MDGYAPRSLAVLAAVAACLLAVVLAGYAVSRLRAPRAACAGAWALLVVGLCAIDRVCADQPAGLRMLALAACCLYAMKAVVVACGRVRGGPALRSWRYLVFATLWFGMRPEPFARRGAARRLPARAVLWEAMFHLSLGVALLAVARLLWTAVPGAPYLATIVALVALSLSLHFGVLALSAAWMRRLGFPCRPLFDAPWRARSLREFWGRRWNVAFAEMTAISVFRPLGGAGSPIARAAAFLFSGLLHEVAISWPVRQGFGLPTLYFALHGAAVLVEPRLRWGAAAGRAWTWVWVLAPLPILFHEPFLRGVVWPLLD